MRIGFVNEYFPPFDIGGAEWSTYYLARSLAKMGNTCVTITPNYGASRYEAKDGIKIYRFWLPRFARSGSVLRAALRENPLFYLYSVLKVWWVIDVEDIEVLHIQNYYLLPGSIIAAWLKGIPAVVTVRDYAAICPVALCLHQQRTGPIECGFLKYIGCLHRFYKDLNREKNIFYRIKFYIDGVLRWSNLKIVNYFMNRANAVVVTSHSMEKTYRHMSKIKPDVIYNPIDFNQTSRISSARRNRRRILYAGRLTKAKGADLLIEALEFISSGIGEVEALFAGEGPLNKELKTKAAVLDSNKTVTLLGRLTHQRLLELYKEVDLVVVPSRWHEPFGRVCLEAMASGVPAVVTNKGALPELVEDKVTGRIVESNPKAIAAAIGDILCNNHFYENLHLRRSEFEKRFSENVTGQHVAIYERLKGLKCKRPFIGKLAHYLTIPRNLIAVKFCPDATEKLILQAKKSGKKRILFGYIKGVGDIPLSLHGFVQYVHTMIPDAEVSAIVRPGLEEAVRLIKEIKHVIVAEEWCREDAFLMKPTFSDIKKVLKSKGLNNHFDMIIPSMTRGRWWKKQFGYVMPKLEWGKEDQQFGKDFVEKAPSLKNSFRIAIQLETQTSKFYLHTRDWPVEKFQKLISLLTGQPDTCVILVGLESKIKIKPDNHLIDMRGKTSLKGALSLIANSHLFIGLDSGLLCLLYYLKDIELTMLSLFGERHGIFYRNEPPTSKQVKHLPIFGANNNIANISVDEVYNLIMKIRSKTAIKKDKSYAQVAS